MEISNYIEPVKLNRVSYQGIADEETLGNDILFFDGTAQWFLDKKFDLAILGVPETRNCQRAVSSEAPGIIRRWLYGMRKISSGDVIADLGNVKGNSLKDRYIALREVAEYLEQQNVVVLVLGGSQDLTVPLCGVFPKTARKFSLTVVDSFIDLVPADDDYSEETFLNKLIADYGPENIEDLSLLGCQNYYCSSRQEQVFSDHYFRLARLKELRDENIETVEVFLRQSDVLSFDFSAIRGMPVLPGGNKMPNGFSELDACRILWYAGASDVLKITGLFNLPAGNSEGEEYGPLGAQMCWHFLEGRGARCGDYPLRSFQDYELKAVYLEEFDASLKFYHNPANGRWWLMIPYGDNERLIPCSGKDYKDAVAKELPALWWHFFMKNSNLDYS
ncbi:arginase family protein [Marinilabilia salmonicolor]|uniref:Arginase family enzyme n=1 Tax=Marinilabilia salmonicolor TaxID=989 RepID=A0A368V8P8_9BACT|nr:arginase [Marinilabilia salmonicolor]RCW37498.1 hypothetical protein DFO77_1056 [Marinilabilia salmonicolor]